MRPIIKEMKHIKDTKGGPRGLRGPQGPQAPQGPPLTTCLILRRTTGLIPQIYERIDRFEIIAAVVQQLPPPTCTGIVYDEGAYRATADRRFTFSVTNLVTNTQIPYQISAELYRATDAPVVQFSNFHSAGKNEDSFSFNMKINDRVLIVLSKGRGHIVFFIATITVSTSNPNL